MGRWTSCDSEQRDLDSALDLLRDANSYVNNAANDHANVSRCVSYYMSRNESAGAE